MTLAARSGTTSSGRAGRFLASCVRVQTPILSSVIALLLGSGCTLLTATPPSVEVAGVELTGIEPLEQVMAVSLCVTNPNDTELAFRGIRVALDIAGAPFAAGNSNGAIALPPRSSTLVPATVVTTVLNVGPQLLGVIQTGGVDYRVRGSIQLTGSLGITLPFSRDGRLDLMETANTLLADAAAAGGTRCDPVILRRSI